MRKNVLIVGATILVVGSIAAFLFNKSHLVSQPSPGSGSVADALKSAITKAVSLTCTYTDPQGNEATAYIKNGAVRSDIPSANPATAASVIVKDNTMYFWNGKKEGFMMPISQDTNPPQGVPMQSVLQLQDMMQGLERSQDSCKPGLVGDDLFVPPADITFKDLSQQQGAAGRTSYPSIDPMQMQQ